MNRDQKIQFLTTNCSCYKNKQAVLANKDNFTDEDLDRLVTEVQLGHERQTVVNSVRGVLGRNDITLNAMPAALADALAKKGKGPKAKKKDDEDEEDEDEEEATENRRVVPSEELTAQEWFAMAPPGMQEVWNSSVRIHAATRNQLVGKVQALIANTRSEPKKAQLTALLNANPTVPQLEAALALASETTTNAGSGFLDPHQYEAQVAAGVGAGVAMPNYGGLGLGSQPIGNSLAPSEAPEDIYAIPTLNFEDIIREQSGRRNAQ